MHVYKFIQGRTASLKKENTKRSIQRNPSKLTAAVCVVVAILTARIGAKVAVVLGVVCTRLIRRQGEEKHEQQPATHLQLCFVGNADGPASDRPGEQTAIRADSTSRR